MDSYEVMKKAVDKLGVKQVASSLNVSTSLVYKWCERPKQDEDDPASGARNPLDRVHALAALADEGELSAWLCERENGFYVHNPEVTNKRVDAEFISNTQEMIQGFSDLLRVMSESIANESRIDEQESAQIRSEWEALKRQGEAFVCACEQGLFG